MVVPEKALNGPVFVGRTTLASHFLFEKETMNKQRTKPKEYLELEISFGDETDAMNTVEKVTWQWRDGKCWRNGSTDTIEQALNDASTAYIAWRRDNP